MTTPNPGPCADWATVADLPDDCTAATPHIADALTAASGILYRLTGLQFSGSCTVTDLRPCGPESASVAPPPFVTTISSSSCSCSPGNCGCSSLSSLELPYTPTTEIISVFQDGAQIPQSQLAIYDYRYLVRRPVDGINPGFFCCQRIDLPNHTDLGTLFVSFKHGIAPPPEGVLAAGVLACEYAKALAGDDECALPPNVSSVVRQGVSFVLSELKDGLTGLGGIVDDFIRAYNPSSLKMPSMVWHPSISPRARRQTWP